MIPALLLAAAATASAQASLDDSFRAAQDAARAAAAQPAVIVDQNALGSWFRKVASTDSTEFDGIATAGVLPQPHFDPGRMHVPVEGEPAYTRGPLDSPGVYVGAHAEGREVDAGLKWDHRYDSQGRNTGLYGWRLFWRVASPAGNVWRNPAPGSDQDIYLNAGDHFAMTLTVRPDGTARLDVHGEGGGPAATAVFPLDGFWNGAQRLPRRFKRVHSIDQFAVNAEGKRQGDEGSPALATKSALSGGRWESAALIGARRVPLTGALAVEWRGPDADAAYRSIFPGAVPDASGGEDIVIRPPAP